MGILCCLSRAEERREVNDAIDASGCFDTRRISDIGDPEFVAFRERGSAESNHPMAFGSKLGYHVAPDKPGGAGNKDVHFGDGWSAGTTDCWAPLPEMR